MKSLHQQEDLLHLGYFTFLAGPMRSVCLGGLLISHHIALCSRLRVGLIAPLNGAVMMSSKTGHLERTAREPREQELLDVKLQEVRQINDRVRLLRLSLPDPINVMAGQWLDTYVPATPGAGGFTITSPPSAASSPSDPYFELAVQESPDNPHAAWLWQPAGEIIGQRLQVRVGGSFVYPPADSDLKAARRVVLVAGGVGVNPLVSMMGEIADRREGVEVRVLYGSKLARGSLDEILFVERVVQMFRGGQLKGSLDVFLTGVNGSSATREDKPNWMSGAPITLREGRMTIRQVKEAVTEGRVKETLVYICGPPAMTDEFAAALSEQGDGVIESRRVMTERWW